MSQKTGRRGFLKAGAAGLLGATGIAPALAQATGETREQLRSNMMAGIEDDLKRDLEMRSKATEELPEPKGIRGMADARFPVYYQNAVPTAMKLVTDYFAAYNQRDVAAVARTLHFPYATYETWEPVIYKTTEEFVKNPPPSIFESTAPEGQFRPGMYDIMDNLQLHTFNPVNVGLELSSTRYRADGYRLGITNGIYAVTNNDGRWGIQLSSIIFTPTEFIGVKYDDALQAQLREGRTSMAAFGDHDYELLTNRGWGTGTRRSVRKSAGIAGSPGATTFFLSAWAGKPMEPYNAKGRKSRLSVAGVPDAAAINALNVDNGPIAQYERGLNASNIVRKDGKPGWFFEMAGGGVGHYGYTMHLPDAKILHASPDKAHSLSGYIRYTKDNVFISETRNLGIMVYDKHEGQWFNAGNMGQSIRRDRTNDSF